MAARHLQKLRAPRLTEPEAEEGADASEEETQCSSKAPFNPFDLLSDEEIHADVEESDGEAEDVSAKAVPPKATPSKQTQSSKQKRRKKKGKADPSDQPDQAVPPRVEEDLDQLLTELNIKLEERQPEQDQKPASAEQPLLSVNLSALKGDEEMRRMFGRNIVQLRHQEDQAADLGRIGNRQVRRAVARRGVHRAQPLKNGRLITPRVTWPPFDAGLSMEICGTSPEGAQMFRYVHSTAYRGVQALFEQCQASMDPNSIAQLLAHHPYHIDALLAMFELYRATGQHEQADELLERCLYALEMALHPFCVLGDANCRIPYESEKNRPLFMALFKHMQGLSRRGLHATAFEVAKMLLLLDPDDPAGALFCIDFFALRSQNLRWLQRLGSADAAGGSPIASLGGGGPLTLPNLAMSVPLAELRLRQHCRERANAAALRAKASSGSSSAAAEADQPSGSEEQECINALAQSVLLHPYAVQQLMSRLQEKGVGTDGEWCSILQQPLFSHAASETSAALAHLSAIFVERHHLVWKAADAQDWLKTACKLATEGRLASSAADFACAREQAFPSAEENGFRHLRTTDFSDSVAAIPAEELQAAVLGGGRGAPAGQGQDAAVGAWEEVLNWLPQEAAAELRNAGHAQLDEAQLQRMGPFRALLESLLPWVNAGQAPEYDEEENADVPQQANGMEREAEPGQSGNLDRHEPDSP